MKLTFCNCILYNHCIICSIAVYLSLHLCREFLFTPICGNCCVNEMRNLVSLCTINALKKRKEQPPGCSFPFYHYLQVYSLILGLYMSCAVRPHSFFIRMAYSSFPTSGFTLLEPKENLSPASLAFIIIALLGI